MLGTAESKIVRALIGGHARSIAKAVMTQDDVKENIIKLLLGKLNEECASLCRKAISSPFRTMPADQMASFKWVDMVTDLKVKAPLFFTLLDSITSRNDHRNIAKVGVAHYPGICTAAAILLKERNREICGLQSLVSLLLYSCHAEKQV